MRWVTEEGPLTGKCLCGKTSYSISGRPQLYENSIKCAFCHCTMCQRVSGSPLMACIGWNTSEVTWASSPSEYLSSPKAKRLFCGVCGSQLGMKYGASPGTTYISVTSFDKPDMFPPIQHSHWPDRRPWLALADALPKHDKGMTEASPVA